MQSNQDPSNTHETRPSDKKPTKRIRLLIGLTLGLLFCLDMFEKGGNPILVLIENIGFMAVVWLPTLFASINRLIRRKPIHRSVYWVGVCCALTLFIRYRSIGDHRPQPDPVESILSKKFSCVSPNFDGYNYRVTELGDQCWFAENLRTKTFTTGEEIPYTEDADVWADMPTAMRCQYEHDPELGKKHGFLYNGYAAKDSRGICPIGWHVPTDSDWQELEVFMGMSRKLVSQNGGRDSKTRNLGAQLKAQSDWPSEGQGTNETGFSGLPSGVRDPSNGNFASMGVGAVWWSSTPSNKSKQWYRAVDSGSGVIYRNTHSLKDGYSVRCLKNRK